MRYIMNLMNLFKIFKLEKPLERKTQLVNSLIISVFGNIAEICFENI